MNYKWTNFNNFGFLTKKFTSEELIPIQNEVDSIKENFDKGIKYNHVLIGHLKHEYQLQKSLKYAEQLILPLVIDYDKSSNYLETFSFLTKDVSIILDKFWVNFQTKTEFNPVHNHKGIMSFVIWLKIPYLIEDENNYFDTGIEENHKRNGQFSLFYTNSLGQIGSHLIPADKNFEGTIALFPSKMCHCVYPFYTSDDYRISVSGNFKLKI